MGITPFSLNFGTRWMGAVRFMPRPLYPRHALHSGLGGTQSRYVSGGKEESHYSRRDSKPGRQPVD